MSSRRQAAIGVASAIALICARPGYALTQESFLKSDGFDGQAEHHKAISALADKLVEAKALAPGDAVILAGMSWAAEGHLQGQFEGWSLDASLRQKLFEDALVTGMTRNQVKVFRFSERYFPGRVREEYFPAEAELMASLQEFRKTVPCSKVLFHRWILSKDKPEPGVAAFDRAYFRVADATTGAIMWSDLLEAETLAAGKTVLAPPPAQLPALPPVPAQPTAAAQQPARAQPLSPPPAPGTSGSTGQPTDADQPLVMAGFALGVVGLVFVAIVASTRR